MLRPTLAPATRWITTAAIDHGDDLTAHLMQRLDISRRRSRALLAQLVQTGWLLLSGTRRHPVYRPGTMRQVVRQYALAGLAEDRAWAEHFAPALTLPPQVARLVQHAFTELLNNAIDHSGGSSVTVSVRQTGLHLQMLVSDDGCGLFNRINDVWQIDDPHLAMLELGKGRLTTEPERHLGQGLFYVARAADVFDLHANRQAFQRRPGRSGWVDGRPVDRQGTSVYLAIALDTPRTLDQVLRAQATSGYGFEHTEVSLRLLAGPGAWLESRAQARRVTQRLDLFQRALLDFSDVDAIGPAFADELFRVYAHSHPGVQLVTTAVAPQVAEMIATIRARDSFKGIQPTRQTLSMLVPPG